MKYDRFKPANSLSEIIKEFWIYENRDQTPQHQKIIPDGYSEIILHFGDPYRINLNGTWESQSRMLYSSQITKFFFLENTGQSAVFGIKLFPYAFYKLFGMDQLPFTDNVIDLEQIDTIDVSIFKDLIHNNTSTNDRIAVVENWFKGLLEKQSFEVGHVQKVIETTFRSNGMVRLKDLSDELQISSRHLERLFMKTTGVTLKFFSRIVRFNYIFQLIKNKDLPWIQASLASGYYDQSHFIKNFRNLPERSLLIMALTHRILQTFF